MASIASQQRRGWVFAWAVLGNLALLGDASHRMLDAAARHAGSSTWPPAELVLAVVFAVGFACGEGHHALARRFVPMLVERAEALRAEPPSWRDVLAPLCVAGLVAAPRARLLRSWGLVVGIVAMVVAIRALPSGIRAGIDLGVGLALTWGALALLRLAAARVRAPAIVLRTDAR